MKRLIVFFLALLVVLLLAFTIPPDVQASEITTEPPITTVSEDLQIVINEDEIIIGEFSLSKGEAIAFLADILDVYAGDLLRQLGIPAVLLAALLVCILIFGIKKLADYIKELRQAKMTNEGISSTNTEVKKEIQTLSLKNAQAEARAAKSEAMNAVILDALVTMTANSSNEAIAAYGAHLKTAAENAMAMDDTINEKEFKSLFKDAALNIGKQVVGNVVQKAKEKKEALIEAAKVEKGKLLAALNDSPKQQSTIEG